MKVTKELKMRLYRDLVRVRKADEKVLECLYAGKLLTFFHSGQGQEAPGVALAAALREDDYILHQQRSHGINKCLPRGMSMKEILSEHFGKATGGSCGYAGFHLCDMNLGICGDGGIVTGELTLAAGVGIACKLRGKGQLIACCFGDGSTGRGPFHEGMLMAAKWNLPVIWFCENNLYGQWTSTRVSHPKQDIADFAFGYGIPSAIVDGQDALAVYEALQPAIKRARDGEGPTLLEIKTYRYRVHSEGGKDYSSQDPGGMRPPAEIEAWKKRDPIKLFQERLLKEGVLTKADVDQIDREAAEEMEEAERFSVESPYPDPKDMGKVLYAD
jgi:TPP-dependent pyruvate/acetoin dehydrogenase alpha subunit